MKSTAFGVFSLVLALVLSVASVSYAQQSEQNPSPSPSPNAQASPSTSAQPGQTPSAQSSDHDAKSTMRKAQGHEGDQMQLMRLNQGGTEADQLQFELLDTHIRLLDRALNQIKQLANNPEQNAAEIVRWTNIRDDNATHIADIVASYFLSQRIVPFEMQQAMFAQPSQTQSQSQSESNAATQGREEAGMQGAEADRQASDAYNNLIQTAHEMLVQAYLVKQTSQEEHVQRLRQLAQELRQQNTNAQKQFESRVKESGYMEHEGVRATSSQGQQPGAKDNSEQRGSEENAPGAQSSPDSSANTSGAQGSS